MEPVLLLHLRLDLFVCSLTLGGGQIQLVHIHFNFKMMLRLRTFGQCTYRLNVPWDNSVNKNAVIYAAHTTLGVRNMPFTNLPNQQL